MLADDRFADRWRWAIIRYIGLTVRLPYWDQALKHVLKHAVVYGYSSTVVIFYVSDHPSKLINSAPETCADLSWAISSIETCSVAWTLQNHPPPLCLWQAAAPTWPVVDVQGETIGFRFFGAKKRGEVTRDRYWWSDARRRGRVINISFHHGEPATMASHIIILRSPTARKTTWPVTSLQGKCHHYQKEHGDTLIPIQRLSPVAGVHVENAAMHHIVCIHAETYIRRVPLICFAVLIQQNTASGEPIIVLSSWF